MTETKQKYLILVGDGMGDEPQEVLDGKTPLEAAHTPNMDRLASCGLLGMTETIAADQEPGSDVANMTILGYDPKKFHTGRAPLEAASMDVKLGPEDVAYRCNLVTLREETAGEYVLADYSAGHITSEESRQLVRTLQENLGNREVCFYAGVSYRHLMVWHRGESDVKITPPHDVTGETVAQYWRVYDEVPLLKSLVQEAMGILAQHPINRQRQAQGLAPANAIWLWGQGRRPEMPTLQELYGITGVAISAVDLIMGLGTCAGLQKVAVEGATGYLDTNYQGKVDAAKKALAEKDLVFLHVEAPDEVSHEGRLDLKLQAIEAFDEQVVGPLLEAGGQIQPLRLLLITDHLTPIRSRTHARGLVPFVIADLPLGEQQCSRSFCERSGRHSNMLVKPGFSLMEAFIRGSLRSGGVQ
ncbi:MAG: cofactor-independent phosphoglycerate mutase [Deltaproteobacteria bacterium]|nr:cofactor-independent phosphoglycerate mutase [Deltaproteobacteria bacterium]MBW2071279.1 cofactor-independent phosphoglycerate mutase [Deltaproteobacteria bacterium]